MKAITTIICSFFMTATIAAGQKSNTMSEQGDKPTVLRPCMSTTITSELTNEFEAIAPSVEYTASEEPTLVAFKRTTNLDAEVGFGNDMLKIANLTEWVHNTIKPTNEYRLFRCADPATILNQALLSMGIKSRIIYLVKEDQCFNLRCTRAVNSVYSQSLGKWIFVDAATNSMIANKVGELLSIDEIIQALKDNQELYFQAIDPSKDMIANSYLAALLNNGEVNLRTPIKSTLLSNETSDKDIRFMELIPEGKDIMVSYMSGDSDVFYINNKNLFWR